MEQGFKSTNAIIPKSKEMQLVYSAFNLSFVNSNNIKRTGYSPDSFYFSINNDKIPENKFETLNSIFNFQNVENAKSSYIQAINGDGGEEKRITTLHSSSLCAFLHFYNINQNPITINGITYNQVYFEVQNKVFENSNRPSNVDIVLKSTQSKTLLFLESKFSEYLSKREKELCVAGKYEQVYNKLNVSKLYNIEKENGKIKLISKDNCNHYLEGIKQIISHYIGVKNFMQNKITECKKIELEPDYKIILGTILFDGWQTEPYSKDYNEQYSLICKLLNEDKTKPQNLTILPEFLTYQNVFKNYNLDENVRLFYNY